MKHAANETGKIRLLLIMLCMVMAVCLISCGQSAQSESEAAGEATTADESTAAGGAASGNEFDAEEYYAGLEHCKEQIEAISDFKPEIVLVLGTGLNNYADKLDAVATIPYRDIEGWPVSTAPDHKGNLIFAEYEGLKLAIMQGRVHYYEGYSMQDVVKPLRVLHMLGADTVILTNAVGAINTDYEVGDFVAVEDHISSYVPSPLRGENIEEFGARFVTMADIYDKKIRQMVLDIGKEKGLRVHSGIFLQTPGPQFETPAEIRMFREAGADTVGMSSAVEAIAAAHMGMRICDINCVTNMAAGIEEFDNDAIKEAGEKLSKDFELLIDELLKRLAVE